MMTVRSGVIGAIVGLILIFGIYALWQHSRSQAAQGRVDRAQAGATIESAKDAIAAQGAANEREAASEVLTKKNEEDIRNAEGADIKISPDVSAAGLRALCLRHAYVDHPKCRVQPVNSQ